MEGAKKAEDKLNMIGVVVVGICGAVLIYVSIVLLQAFYMNETAEVQTMADYGGQDSDVKSVRAAQTANLTQAARNQAAPGEAETFRIPIDRAMALVATEAKADPANLVPVVAKSEKATIKPIFGRPQLLEVAPPPAGSGSGTGSDAGSGSGSAAGSSAGSAAGSGSGSGSGAGTGGGAPPPAPPAPAPTPGGSGH